LGLEDYIFSEKYVSFRQIVKGISGSLLNIRGELFIGCSISINGYYTAYGFDNE